MRHVPDVSGENLVPFICDSVEEGSEILTDGWNGYNDLKNHGYKHSKIIVSATGDPAHVSLPAVHRISSLLKRWLIGTHQGAVSQKHLDYYLDEFIFRFNRRSSKARGLLFYRLIEQAVCTDPTPYHEIVSEKHYI